MNANTGKPTSGDIISQTVRRFREEFQIHFPPALLASAIAYTCIYALELIRAKLVFKPSLQSILERTSSPIAEFLYLLARMLVWTVECWMVWLVFTLVLAAISVQMLRQKQSANEAMPFSKAFQQVSKSRLGVLTGISGLAGLSTALFNLFAVPFLIQPLALLLYRLDLIEHYPTVRDWSAAALTLVFAAAVAKITLAIPEVVDDRQVSFEQSFRNSMQATDGWEGFFLLEFGFYGLICGILYWVGKEFIRGSWTRGSLSFTGYELMLAAFIILLTALAFTLIAIAHSSIYISLKYGNALPVETAAGAI